MTETHQLKIYGIQGNMLLHLWFSSEDVMRLDLDVAMDRKDVAYVDVIDCVNHTTIRKYRP